MIFCSSGRGLQRICLVVKYIGIRIIGLCSIDMRQPIRRMCLPACNRQVFCGCFVEYWVHVHVPLLKGLSSCRSWNEAMGYCAIHVQQKFRILQTCGCNACKPTRIVEILLYINWICGAPKNLQSSLIQGKLPFAGTGRGDGAG